MTTSTLLKYLTWGYSSNIGATEFEEIRVKLVKYQKERKFEDSTQLAEGLVKDFPEFQILHQALMRSRIDKISSGVSTIKTILVIYFILSILGALIVFAELQ